MVLVLLFRNNYLSLPCAVHTLYTVCRHNATNQDAPTATEHYENVMYFLRKHSVKHCWMHVSLSPTVYFVMTVVLYTRHWTDDPKWSHAFGRMIQYGHTPLHGWSNMITRHCTDAPIWSHAIARMIQYDHTPLHGWSYMVTRHCTDDPIWSHAIAPMIQ